MKKRAYAFCGTCEFLQLNIKMEVRAASEKSYGRASEKKQGKRAIETATWETIEKRVLQRGSKYHLNQHHIDFP